MFYQFAVYFCCLYAFFFSLICAIPHLICTCLSFSCLSSSLLSVLSVSLRSIFVSWSKYVTHPIWAVVCFIGFLYMCICYSAIVHPSSHHTWSFPVPHFPIGLSPLLNPKVMGVRVWRGGGLSTNRSSGGKKKSIFIPYCSLYLHIQMILV